MSKKSLYEDLLRRAQNKSSGSRASGYGFHSGSGGGGRFHTPTDKKKKKDSGPERNVEGDRPPAQPVHKDGRVIRIDESDRDLAYRPPVQNQDQAIVWKPPTFWEIMSDLGLRVVEVGVASIAQEVVYFFSKRRFMPNFMKRG